MRRRHAFDVGRDRLILGIRERCLKWLLWRLLHIVRCNIVVHRHRSLLPDRHRLRRHSITWILHRLSRRRARHIMTHGMLEVRHVRLIRPWHHIRIHIGINHILRDLARVKRKHRRCHRPGLEGDVCTAIRSRAILKGRRFENYALAIAFAVALRFDAIFANWPFLAALDATFATSQTSGLRSLAG